MKFIRYSLLALLAFVCLFVFVVSASRHPAISLAFSASDQKVAGASLNGLTISVQKAPIPLSFGWEKHRRVVVCDGLVFCTSKHLVADYAQKVNLYRHKSGSIVLVNDIWMMELLSGPMIRIFEPREENEARLREPGWLCDEVGPLAETGFPQSIYFKDMEFLGAFSARRFQVPPFESLIYRGMDFLPSSTHGEKLCRYPGRG